MTSASDLTGALAAAQSFATVVINERASALVQVADLVTALNTAQIQYDTLARENAVTQAELAAANAEIVRLQAIIDGDEEPPPVDPMLWGMSSPRAEWVARASEVGPGLGARRIFLDLNNSPDLALVREAQSAGLMPVVSLSTNDWSGAIAGNYDTRIKAWGDAFQGTIDGGRICATIKHEPSGDGDETLWGRMLTRCLPLLRRPNVDTGPIDNGFKWSPTKAVNKGWTDAKLATVYTPELLAVCQFLAADFYHGGTASDPGENAAPKIAGFSAWVERVGFLGELGAGEFNGIGASDITAACDTFVSDPRFGWACVFNSNRNNRDGVQWQLTGDRLAAFQTVIQ